MTLIGRKELLSTRPALEQLAQADPPPPPIVFAALAELEGGLSPERTARLLERAPARYRQVAARHASGEGVEDQLADLLSQTRPNTGDQLLGVIELSEDTSEQKR